MSWIWLFAGACVMQTPPVQILSRMPWTWDWTSGQRCAQIARFFGSIPESNRLLGMELGALYLKMKTTPLYARFRVSARSKPCGASLLCLVGVLPVGNAIAGLTFTPLGDLPGGNFFSLATDISADGTTVVGASFTDRGEEAFRWTASTGMVPLGELPTGISVTHASAVSQDGQVIVGVMQTPNLADQAFRWTASTGFVGLGHLPGGGSESLTTDLSADGSVVVGYSDSTGGSQAFRWTAGGGMVGLGDLPGGEFSSIARGVSADGSIVVGSSSYGTESGGYGSAGFLWTSGAGMTALDRRTRDRPFGEAAAVSADGLVIVGTDWPGDGNYEAVRWTRSPMAMVGLGDLPGLQFDSHAFDVSADGSKVVGVGTGSPSTEAFLWDEANGMRAIREILSSQHIDVTSWWFERADGISADGDAIIGQVTARMVLRGGWYVGSILFPNLRS
jgi:probable HAF family extracellular repeat protein